MGEYGTPKRLMNDLQSKFGIDEFLETGTYLGDTTEWASAIFKKVTSFEAMPDLHAKATERLKHKANVQCIKSECQVGLRDLKTDPSKKNLYWLDAHWSGNHTYGSNNQCPLLEEIDAINGKAGESFILIDDARIFLAPPPRPWDANQHPSFPMILKKLTENHNRYTAVYRDVIVAVPEKYSEEVKNIIQKHATEDWEDYFVPSLAFKKAVNFFVTGIRLFWGQSKQKLLGRPKNQQWK